MSFINVLFKRVTTAIRGTEAIEDGKILLDYERPSIYVDNGSTRVELTPRDTALSTTSTNAIANNALTNSIINTTAEVSAITANNIPCGTKPVKELITSLNGSLNNIDIRYNATTQQSEWSVRGADTWNPFKQNLAFTLYGAHSGGSYNPVTYAQLNNFNVTNYKSLTLSGLSVVNGKNTAIQVVTNTGTTILSNVGTVDISQYTTISIKIQTQRNVEATTNASISINVAIV